MKMSTVVVLTAMGVAALASPVMAQTWRNSNNVPVSENNALWGLENAPPHEHAYGSSAHLQTSRIAPGTGAVAPHRIIDCVHVPFPQCSGS
jgi:hypothetical protein